MAAAIIKPRSKQLLQDAEVAIRDEALKDAEAVVRSELEILRRRLTVVGAAPNVQGIVSSVFGHLIARIEAL